MRTAALVALACSLAGCSSSSDEDDGKQADPNVVSFHADLTVAVGDETQQCKLVQMPSDRGELAVTRIHHEYTAGSHHFLLFRTDLTEIPEGREVLSPCNEGTGSWMRDVRGVAYAAQAPEGAFDMPESVGIRFQPGEVLLLQAHYLNTTQSEIDAKVDVHLDLADPATLSEEAGVLFFYNPQIAIDPMSAAKAELTCPVPEDVNLVFAASHMHKRGVAFEATSSDTAAQALAGGPLYVSDEWSEPVPRVFEQSPPLTLKAGSSITYACDFENTETSTIVQGESADVNEMCMFVGSYWPRKSETFEWCYDGVTGQGGTASAAATITCLVLCGQDNPECSAGCWKNACPNAPMKIAQSRDCLPQCMSKCSGGLQSAACAECANELCPEKYAELMAATCE
jgi:hypothetical protein